MGVLSVGLPPSRAAGSDTFRVDHVVAVVHALQTTGRAEEYLGPDGLHISAEFGQQLGEALDALQEKELVVRCARMQDGAMRAAFGSYGVPLAVCLGLNLAASVVVLMRPRT